MLRALSLAAYARTAALATSPASGSAGVHTQAVTAAAPEGVNCSDPKLYPRNPFTHKAHPCADFCAGKCAFNPTAPLTLELTRMTPRNVTGIANKDTGDAAGDLFFTLISATKPTECAKAKPAPWAGCFLNGDNIFIKSQVLVDGNWGIYQECNPATVPLPSAQANTGSFACCGSLDCTGKPSGFLPAPKPKNSSDYCYCPRTNRTVGRSTVVEHFTGGPGSAFQPSYLGDTAKLLAGNWYSTPAAGECKGSALPGQGGCTWKVQKTLAVVNQSCVKANVYGAIEKHCPAIFESCASPYNRTDACYADVFFGAFLGNSTFGCAPLSRGALLDTWEQSFTGGCPPVTIEGIEIEG